MRFTKMQGLGNDYVYLDCTVKAPEDLPELARRMSERHFGVGSDGLIGVFPSSRGDFRMRMFNADGSEGAMCGNGIRCVGKFIHDKGLSDKTVLRVETGAGIRTVTLALREGRVEAVTVDMGAPTLWPEREINVKGIDYTVIPVSMGNPHAVLFVRDIEALDLEALGPGFECHSAFPDRVNTEFVRVRDRKFLNMRVWERGSGETLACGTGACAALAAAVQAGRADREAVVSLPGGELSVRWAEADGHIYMTGPAVTVFEGEWPED